jgi:hypothetical protein
VSIPNQYAKEAPDPVDPSLKEAEETMWRELFRQSEEMARSPPTRPASEPRVRAFIKGPIAYDWLCRACKLPGSGFAVVMFFRFYADRYRRPPPPSKRVGPERLAELLEVSESSIHRGLRAAERVGLLAVERKPGCHMIVTIPKPATPESDPKPLFGPISLRWWLAASRLPGKTLQTAAVCWLLKGWDRSLTFEMKTRGWGELGLTQGAVHRGLIELEKAGLIGLQRTPRCSIVVTIRIPEGEW